MAWQSGRCRGKRFAAVVVLAGVSLAAAACGGDDDDDAAEQTDPASADETTTTAEATSTTLSPEEQVVADYRAAREAIFAAYDPPNPTYPDLVARVTGEALGAAQNSIGQAQVDGVGYTGDFELNPTFVNMSGDEAVVEDCLNDHTQQVNAQTGEASGQPADQVHHDRIDLQRLDGVWKIVRIQELEEPCTP